MYSSCLNRPSRTLDCPRAILLLSSSFSPLLSKLEMSFNSLPTEIKQLVVSHTHEMDTKWRKRQAEIKAAGSSTVKNWKVKGIDAFSKVSKECRELSLRYLITVSTISDLSDDEIIHKADRLQPNVDPQSFESARSDLRKFNLRYPPRRTHHDFPNRTTYFSRLTLNHRPIHSSSSSESSSNPRSPLSTTRNLVPRQHRSCRASMGSTTVRISHTRRIRQ